MRAGEDPAVAGARAIVIPGDEARVRLESESLVV